jgi:hypothetical protein
MFLARARLTFVAAGQFQLLILLTLLDLRGFRVIIGMTILVNDCTFLQNPARQGVFYEQERLV